MISVIKKQSNLFGKMAASQTIAGNIQGKLESPCRDRSKEVLKQKQQIKKTTLIRVLTDIPRLVDTVPIKGTQEQTGRVPSGPRDNLSNKIK